MDWAKQEWGGLECCDSKEYFFCKNRMSDGSTDTRGRELVYD